MPSKLMNEFREEVQSCDLHQRVSWIGIWCSVLAALNDWSAPLADFGDAILLGYGSN
jgi:hypothetical protein